MAYRKYRCTVSHYSDRFYKKDLTYLFTSDPGARFEITEDESRNAAGVDLDGTWFPGPVGFDDLRFSLTASKNGILDKPDYDYDDVGPAFPQNDATEILYLTQLTPHMLLTRPDVIWHPHLHYFQDEEEIPTFYYRMRLISPGGAVAAFSDPVASLAPVFPYTEGKIHQILQFPSIRAYDMGFTDVACLIDVMLYRDDNTVTGDVVAKEFDFHVPIDAPLGSGQEFIK